MSSEFAAGSVLFSDVFSHFSVFRWLVSVLNLFGVSVVVVVAVKDISKTHSFC